MVKFCLVFSISDYETLYNCVRLSCHICVKHKSLEVEQYVTFMCVFVFSPTTPQWSGIEGWDLSKALKKDI